MGKHFLAVIWPFFFSRIMMLNSSIALDIICHIFLNTGAMFLYFKVQIIKTFLKKYRFGQLLVFPWQFERRLSDWHWFCPDSPHSWPWTRLFVHRLYPPCSTLSKKRKQYRYSMYFILNFSFISLLLNTVGVESINYNSC